MDSLARLLFQTVSNACTVVYEYGVLINELTAIFLLLRDTYEFITGGGSEA